MINSMRITSERVALEAFVAADLVGLVKRAFPQLLEDFKGLMGFTSSVEQAIQLTPDARSFVNDIARKHSYVDIAPLTAWVPQGFVGDYLSYAPSLQAQVTHVEQLLGNTLGPFTGFLAKVLTNYDDQLSTQTTSYIQLEKVRNGLEADNAKHFKAGSTAVQSSLGDVVKRNADWEPVLQLANELVTRMNKIDRRLINKKIAESSDLMERLIRQIKNNKIDHLTPQVITNISNGAFQVAKEVEFYSIVYYRVLAFSDAISKTVTATKAVFKP